MNLLSLNKNNEFIYTLLKIKKEIPSAIIAGGAIRDLYHNKFINDIDIYVPNIPDLTDSEDFWRNVFDIKEDGMYSTDHIKHLGEEDDESYEEKNHIGLVWEMSSGKFLYNIIVVDLEPIEYVIRFFDIGLCKAYCDGTRIRLTADFMHDSQFKRLTIVGESMPQTEFNHMMEYHIQKLQKKYPGYTLVIPPAYDELHKEYSKKLSC